MRKFVTLSLAAAALAGAAGVAYAQAGDGPALTRADVERRTAEAFARMDANGDGVLDREDREDRREAAFERLDADGNGALSREEFSAQREQRAERRGPGRRGGARMARRADTNRDGTVTGAEFASAALARFDRADADKDGTLSADERPARRMRRTRDDG